MKWFLYTCLLISSVVKAETFCVAHQGSFKHSPANSLLSLQEAIDLGTDGVEFDIRHTKEGFPILMHDSFLTSAESLPGKNCPKSVPIKKLSLQEIRENCGLRFDKKFVPIPTLEEALAVIKTGFVFIELKDRPSKLTRNIIKEFFYHRPQDLRVMSFKVGHLNKLFKSSDVDSDFWSSVSGMDLDVAPWGTPEEYGVSVWNRMYLLSGEKYRKRETAVWTVNREKRIELFLNKGVGFVITNEVQKCLELKANRDHH